MQRNDLDDKTVERLKRRGIDVDNSLRILEAWNSGRLKDLKPVVVKDLPAIEGRSLLDLSSSRDYRFPLPEAERNVRRFLPGLDLGYFGKPEAAGESGASIVFGRPGLEELGVRLYPFLSYGILNGGSATTYADFKKNQALNEPLFRLLKPAFVQATVLAKDRAKGLTPAYSNPDGSPGYSFFELKMRAVLIQALRWQLAADRAAMGTGFPPASRKVAIHPPLAPIFQMTSLATDKEIAETYENYRVSSPLLRDLIAETGLDVTQVKTGVQTLVSAFTHSEEGERKRLFTKAWGIDGEVLGLPGGHGQNFLVLREVYKSLYAQGKRFVYLGNVDNLGYVPDPAELAILALSGKKAGFDFAFKTAVDVKGGILVIDDRGRLNCADIGPAVSIEEVRRVEAGGRPILFNAATGLFDLEALVSRLDEIIETLPLRFSDQDKDAGKYSQAEQVTWEVIGLLEDPLIFGVRKDRRFLAAKMLLESLITSGLELANPAYPEETRKLAESLHSGFRWNMENSYGMRLEAERWEPLPLEDVIAGLKQRSC